MTRFARLYAAIDATTSTNTKVEAMTRYFAEAPAGDAAWAVFFLTGRRLTRLIAWRAVSDWAMAAADVEPWLLDECYAVVGDGAETTALLFDAVPVEPQDPLGLAAWMDERVLALRGRPIESQRSHVLAWIRGLTRWERFTLLKVLTGELRVGVSQTLVVRALAARAGLPETTVAWRLAGAWTPSAVWFLALTSPQASADDVSRPFPFALASPLDPEATTEEALGERLGRPEEWQIEWKWDGIRAQVLRRGERVLIWSRGDELLTERFPEIRDAALGLPDGTVIDGEILAWRDDRPLPFSALQQRIGRERDIARTARTVPVAFVAYDLLQRLDQDLRDHPLQDRQRQLADLVSSLAPAPPATGTTPGLPFDDSATTGGGLVIRLSPPLDVAMIWWRDAIARQAAARAAGVEGLMLKRRSSPYTGGRRRGDWWKWKVEPYTVDAVLIYAQPGSGKRASLLTDYTFGLWDGDTLVPVAKAYSGLSNDEIAEMDRWIRRHTTARFGPVRHVEPVRVVELGFEAIAPSSRHRSGIAVRFPRMRRLRFDKPAREADSVATLRALIATTRDR